MGGFLALSFLTVIMVSRGPSLRFCRKDKKSLNSRISKQPENEPDFSTKENTLKLMVKVIIIKQFLIEQIKCRIIDIWAVCHVVKPGIQYSRLKKRVM